MFDFLKKKKISPKQQPEEDFNPLSAASMIDYIKSQKPDITDKEILETFRNMAAPADDLDHLDEDGELPWGWVTANADFTDRIGKEFSYFWKAWIDARNGEPSKEMNTLKSLLQYMDDVQQMCDQKGECFGFWCANYLMGKEKVKAEKRISELEATII